MKTSNLVLKSLITAGIIFTMGCQNQPQVNKNIEISLPWENFCNTSINKLKKEGKLAACSCDETNSLSGIDFAKDIANAEAREKLASILKTKIASLTEGYRNRVKNLNETMEGSNFEKVFKEVVNEELKGSYPVETKTYKTEENKYKVCSVVALDFSLLKKIVSQIDEKTGLNIDSNLLYEELKSYKAHQRLDKELSR